MGRFKISYKRIFRYRKDIKGMRYMNKNEIVIFETEDKSIVLPVAVEQDLSIE